MALLTPNPAIAKVRDSADTVIQRNALFSVGLIGALLALSITDFDIGQRKVVSVGLPPVEWRGEIRASCGCTHGDPFHAGPRLGRGAIADGRMQTLPIVQPYATRPTVQDQATRLRLPMLGIRGLGSRFASMR